MQSALTRFIRSFTAASRISRRVPTLNAAATRSVSHFLVTSATRSNPIHAVSSSSSLFLRLPSQQQHRQQLRSIFIQSEDTPNPESVKFVPTGIVVLQEGDTNGFYVTNADPVTTIALSPLAKELFKINGVKGVYLGFDFVTVTKSVETPWKMLRPQILDVLMNFFDGDTPALLDQPEIIDTTILDDDDEVVAMIKELIESRIRPAVQEDGGDIRYVSFEEDTGLVTVELAGSCVGCPSSSVTLKQGVENMLQHYIPEVTAVVALEEEPEEGDGGEGYKDVKVQKSYEERLQAAGIPFSD